MPILLWSVLACTEPEPASGAFDALTYNVAGLPEGISGSHPERNMPLIAPLLDGYDLALVQEDFVYHDDLDTGTTHPYRTEWEEPDERFVGDGLNLFSRFPLGEVDRVQWVECHGMFDASSDCLAEKGFLVTGITLAEDTSLVVVNHHAEAGGNPGDVAARAAGYAQMAEWLAEHAGDRAILVGGDTNLHGYDADDEPILQAFLEDLDLADSCRALSCGEEHIDRFLYRAGSDLDLSPVAWAVAEEFVDGSGEPLSDHPAIRVGWEWSVPADAR